MNCDGKMSFGDFIFPVNPYLIRITHKREVSEQHIPGGESVVSDMGRRAARISGEGELFGSGCAGDFARLKRLYERSAAEMLYLPSQRPVYAVFEKLELIGKDIGDVIRYSFSFAVIADAPSFRRRAVISDGRKCLWDYAFENGLGTELLCELNPGVKRPDLAIPAGRRVALC